MFVRILKLLADTGGQMALCCMNVGVEEVFNFAGLDAVFSIYPTRDDAVKALASTLSSAQPE